MKLICGLGNPGREYEQHRHNVGFRVVELLGSRAGIRLDGEKFDGLFGQGTLGSERVALLLPQTFMNASGQSLAAAARFYKVEPQDTLVIHDELDLPFGRLQLKKGGGTGGHNGLESVVESWGNADFCRLRFGIGKPEGPGAKERVVGHVLAHFRGEETKALPDLLARSADAAESWAIQGLATAMNRFNTRA